MTRRLEDTVVAITGTGGGQGKAAAELFADEGATVVGCDLREDASRETTREVCEAGGEMLSMEPVDLGDEDDVEEWIDFVIDECGRLDVLYNNAGASRRAPVTELSTREWEFTLRNELDVIYNAVKHAVPVIRDSGGGSIINTASTVTMRVPRDQGHLAHAASKGGVLAMTRVLAAELGEYGIRANAISPGPTRTERIPHEGTDAIIEEQAPLGRIGKPEDVARCALFLASEDSKFVTGQNLVVDGGLTVV